MSYEPETQDRPSSHSREFTVICGEHSTPKTLAVWTPTPEGAALRLMRDAKGVTLRRAAKEADMRPSLWSDLEAGRLEPVEPFVWTIMRAAVVTAERYSREGGAP